MKQLSWFGAIALVTGLGLWGAGLRLPTRVGSELPMPVQTISPRPEPLEFQTISLPQAIVYTLRIPAGGQFVVTPVMSPELDSLENFARQTGAIAVLNAGFFDPVNQQSTSYITSGGQRIADPRQNRRLTENPDLVPYFAKIFNRSEFRRYQCGDSWRYGLAQHQESPPQDCQLVDAVGAGPRLLPSTTLEQEGFTATVKGRLIRDAIGSTQPNARSAIGLMADGSLLWVMVAQKSEAPESSGFTLAELTDFLRSRGAVAAINLDGGSSSALYYQGKTTYGKVNSQGDRVRRRVKSVLLLKQTTTPESGMP